MTGAEDIQAGDDALAVLVALAGQTQGAEACELAAAAGLTPARVGAALEDLTRLGYAEEDPTFAPRFRLAELAEAMGAGGRNARLRRLAWPHMQRLQALSGQNVSLHVLDGDHHRVVDVCPRRTIEEVRSSVKPSYARPVALRVGATALVLLAFLPEAVAQGVLSRTGLALDPTNEVFTDLAAWRVAAPSPDMLAEARRRGYAFTRGGRSAGGDGRAMTTPVFDARGAVCAGLCLFSRSAEFDEARAEALAPAVAAEAAALAAAFAAA